MRAIVTGQVGMDKKPYLRAVAELGPNRCGQFLHLMPAFGALLSWLLLDERLYGFHWAGIGLIATGLWLATVRQQS